MRVIFLVGLLSLFVMGCSRGEKGDKGDTGSSGLVGTKTYTGTPISNPYQIVCQEIGNLDRQVITVYFTDGISLIPLPISDATTNHMYSIIANAKSILLMTVYSDGTMPATALSDSSGQYQYRIDIKTFASAPAKSAYLSKTSNISAYDSLIYGAY